MLRLYDFWESGNAYKVRLLLAQLGVPFERVQLDIVSGETRTPPYRALNPNQRVPLVEWPDGRRLAESDAILFHLAEGTPLLPDDSWERAQVLQWLFFEQYSHEPYIAVVRFWHFTGAVDQHRGELAEKMARGYEALEVMEAHLAQRPFFVAPAATPSPTSRSTPTPTSRTRAASTSGASRPSTPGSNAFGASRGT